LTEKHHQEEEELSSNLDAKQSHHRRRGDSHAAELDQRDMEPHWQLSRRRRRAVAKGDEGKLQEEEQLPQLEDLQIGNQSSSAAVALQRVKRKSGKTTGALSRPKGGGDSSSKTTSRKDKGKDAYKKDSICIAARHWQCHSAHDKIILNFKAAVAVSLSVCPSVLCL